MIIVRTSISCVPLHPLIGNVRTFNNLITLLLRVLALSQQGTLSALALHNGIYKLCSHLKVILAKSEKTSPEP